VEDNAQGRFGLVVRFDLKPHFAEAFDQLVEGTVRQIRESEPGTLAYLVHGVSDAPASRVFYELYRDKDAFEVHERQPHVKHFLAERGAYLVSDPVVWWLSPSGGVTRKDPVDSDG
jgi:quinol monooxygenase YgiN